jgi:hypothetical protein
VSSGETVRDVDFVLYPSGSVAGTVTAESGGAPLPHVTVGVERTSDHRWWYDCTNDSGEYQVQGIPYGDYKVWARGDSRCNGDQNLVREYWQEKTNWDEADVVTISQAQSDVTGIGFTLAQGGSVTGQVLQADGTKPLQGACVNVSSSAPDWNGIASYCCTRDDGTYSIHGVAVGDVYVRTHADCQGMHPELQDEWYAAGASTPDGYQAGVVAVRAGQTVPDIDFTLDLAPTGSVSPDQGGTITSSIDMTTTISFPPAAVSQPMTITFKIAANEPFSTQLRFLGQSFSIEAVDSSGAPVTSFLEPFTLTTQYDDDDVEQMDEASLKLYYQDSGTRRWEAIDTSVDADNNTVTAGVEHLTAFAVLGESIDRVLLPVVVKSH